MTAPLNCTEAERLDSVLYGIGVDSLNRLDVLLGETRHCGPDVQLQAFADHWNSCDANWGLKVVVLTRLLRLYREGACHDDLPNEARVFLDGLPDPIPVYRGCSQPHVRGLAWSTDRGIAENFAWGHRGISVPDAVIASAEIPKDGVFFTCVDREEFEVVLDPRRLQKLKVEPHGILN